jgi:hypothetical protein
VLAFVVIENQEVINARKANLFTIQTNSVDCITPFEAAGSVVTVKRSPVSKRVKARDAAKGTDILSSGQSKPPLERDSV